MITTTVTKHSIRLGRKNINDCQQCIGALTLRKALTEARVQFNDVYWGFTSGNFTTDQQNYKVTSHKSDNTPFDTSRITKPAEIYFKITKI